MNETHTEDWREEYWKRVNELRQCTHWGDTEEGPIFEFGGRTQRFFTDDPQDGAEVFTVTDWGNIEKFITQLLKAEREALCEEVEKLHPIYDINDRPHVSRDDILAILKAKR